MKPFKKVVDERQELELLKIEHVFFWVAFWGLCIAIVVETMFLSLPFVQVLPEWIIFMVMCVGMIIGSIKKGQWDYYTEPSPKTYLIGSLIGSGVFSLIFAVAQYWNNAEFREHLLVLLLLTGALFVVIFGLIFGVMLLSGTLVKRKREKLASKYDEP